MHEWTDLSRGRAVALVTARDPREFPVGVFHRDPVPPPNLGPGTFTWFATDDEAADFMAGVVPTLLLDPASWPDFDDLAAETRRIVRAVPDEGTDRMEAITSLREPWGVRADFVWWGDFTEIEESSSDFGRYIRLQFAEYHDIADDTAPVEADALVRFLRVYPY